MKYNHYFKPCPYSEIDLYRIGRMFEITDNEIFHAFKKIVASGRRGNKSKHQDIIEAIDALHRYLEIEIEDISQYDGTIDPCLLAYVIGWRAVLESCSQTCAADTNKRQNSQHNRAHAANAFEQCSGSGKIENVLRAQIFVHGDELNAADEQMDILDKFGDQTGDTTVVTEIIQPTSLNQDEAQFIHKQCPKCGSQLLSDLSDNEWCPFVECDWNSWDEMIYSGCKTCED